MATFGIEGIRHFGHLRASGMASAEDLTYVFNICNGLDQKLRAAGHQRAFYWAETDCWEIDMRDDNFAGIDHTQADHVDLFFILTHGNYYEDQAHLAYDRAMERWIADSNDWRYGENWNLEWLLIYGCHTIDKANPLKFWDMFQRLHLFCGAYGDMWDSITTDEVGEDVGDNLTSGDAVADSWIDGVSDWFLDNHPMVLAMERRDTWNNGNFNWPATTMRRDHLWGHGTTVNDIFSTDRYWMSWRWAEG